MSNRFSDSDETVGSDSDVTLPPDDRDTVNYSPDLFDNSSDGCIKRETHKETYKQEKMSLHKHRSQVHEISDSESEEEMILTKNKPSKPSHLVKGSPKHKSDGKELKREQSQKKDIPKNPRQSDTASAVQRKNDKQSGEKSTVVDKSDKRKFINDFLNMSDTEEEEKEEEDNKKLQMFPGDTKKDTKLSDIQKNPKHLSEFEQKESSTSKPHKQNYSKPFLSDVTKHENSTNSTSVNKSKLIKGNNKHSSSPSPIASYKSLFKGDDKRSASPVTKSSNNIAIKGGREKSPSPSTKATLNRPLSKGDNERSSSSLTKTNKKIFSKDENSTKSSGMNKPKLVHDHEKFTSPSTKPININRVKGEHDRSSSPTTKPISRTLVKGEGQRSPSSEAKETSKHLINHDHDRSENPSTVPLKRKHSTSPVSHELKRKHSRSPVPPELRKAVTEILNENTSSSTKKKKRPPCQYGAKCYRKNPSHLEEFSHGPDSDDKQPPSSSTQPPCKKVKVDSQFPSTSKPAGSRSGSPPRTPRSVTEKFKQAQPYSFFFTKVTGIADKYNSSFAMDIKDILSAEMGNLTASCQLDYSKNKRAYVITSALASHIKFNFMFEVPWLMKQYPPQFRSKPLLLVHGEKGPSEAALRASAMAFTNIRFCQAKLEMMFGTHHTKMMFLLYDMGLRVVIHTSNLIDNDWYKKTQGIWISQVFPRLPAASMEIGDSPTHFKRDLYEYVAAYKAYQLKDWLEHIAQHDMSSARVVIIGSVPGRHIGDRQMSSWGHMKLRKTLKQHGPDQATVKTWPVIGQFSSIGSMGPNKENWVCGEWLQSLGATKSAASLQSNTRLQLVFPSKDNVRLSLEGFPAGGSIPYTAKQAKKQVWLHDFFHIWKSDGTGRSRAMPHIKTYIRPTQDGTKAAWFVVTSANLSKAAWGAFEKKGAQLMIRSYEIGVLFLPKFFDGGETLDVTNDIEVARSSNKFLVPFGLPTTLYEKKDRPWMWDIPYMDLPDTNGNIWCPFSK